ncbi:hypothetical protein K438DRAFT_1997038 [Mycena galopus ATCC 62051]|nr:hypothetical protein K438DRAFT_1997038 [Mycena galopus ATCC 62051]
MLQPPGLFLNLPAELRQKIYDAVLDLPLDSQVARRKPKELRTAQGSPAQDSDRLLIPWLSLMLVCKTFASEVHYHVHASGNTTYELEVDNLERDHILAHKVTWRQIPCPPRSARTLHTRLELSSRTWYWAGGPLPVLSGLYQVLNCFIHNGPLLARKTPLSKHIHLETLILQIRVMKPGFETRPAMECKLSWHLRKLRSYIRRIVDQGVLFGAVDKIVLRYVNDNDEQRVAEWNISRQTIGNMREWNKYDCAWGVPGSSSLVATGVLQKPFMERVQLVLRLGLGHCCKACDLNVDSQLVMGGAFCVAWSLRAERTEAGTVDGGVRGSHRFDEWDRDKMSSWIPATRQRSRQISSVSRE